jgi:hypothetical protein
VIWFFGGDPKEGGHRPRRSLDDIWSDAVDRMIDFGLEPMDAIDAAHLKAEHDAIVRESEESEAAAERGEAVGEQTSKTPHEGGTQLPGTGTKDAGEAAGVHEGSKTRPEAGGVSGEPERGGPPGGATTAGERPGGSERTPAGEQHTIPGTERISDGERAKRGAEQPLKPTVPQKPADEGLFSDQHTQTDLVDMARKKPHADLTDEERDAIAALPKPKDGYR